MAVFVLQLPSHQKAIAGLQMMTSLFIWQKPILSTMPACPKGLGVTTDRPFRKALPMGILGTSWKVRMSVMFFSATLNTMFLLSPAISDDERALILPGVES